MAGHGNAHAPVDVFRKSTIIAVLFSALIAMYQYVVPGGSGVDTVLLAVGFVILASFTIGELAEVVKLPHITGYLLTGLFLGASVAHTLSGVEFLQPYLLAPFDHGLLDGNVLSKLGPMDTLALALICLTAGGELKIDDLRQGFGRITAILGMQTLTIMIGIPAFVYAISGPIPFLVFEPIADLGLVPVLSLGLVLGSVALATSPAATIAIINSTGAKGPMTSNVLPVVVLKDVVVVLLFSAAMAVAVSTMPGATGESSLGATLVIIVASLLLGAGVGGLIHLYLRYVGAEILLFIVGMVYATAEGATLLTHWIHPGAHPELALVFIAAGFTTSNFSSKGDELIHEVERLSLPVYVVFFTMAGAKLHLEDLATTGLFAALMVVTRIAMLVIGARAGAVISGADAMTRKHGWMGFISQAGLALTLAGTIQATFGPGVGDGLFSLLLAGVALNEVLGPVALQIGLQLAGETAAQRGEAHDVEVDHEVEASPARVRETEDSNAWGTELPTGDVLLDDLTAELEADLRQLVRDLEVGPLTEVQRSNVAYIRTLRLDFLRFHRRVKTVWIGEPERDKLPHQVRRELADLASRWHDHLLSRAATLKRPGWSPDALRKAIDQRAAGWDNQHTCEVDPIAMEITEHDRAWKRLQRRWLWLRSRLTTVERQVPLHDLMRYHFRGVVPGRLEGLAALLVNTELDLVNRTAGLFQAVDSGTDRLLTYAKTASPEEITAAIDALRVEIDADFNLAGEEAAWIVDDGRARTSQILGSALQDFRSDLVTIGTPDLSPRQRRFNKVYERRRLGKQAITTGLDDARIVASRRYGALALAFEVVTLEAHVKEAVDEHATYLARQIRGKVLTQLDRAGEGLQRLRSTAEALLMEEDPSTDLTGERLAIKLASAIEPTQRIISEGVESAVQLRDWLASEESDEPLLNAVLQAAGDLTERYDVPGAAAPVGEWVLPAPVPTTEIPFRELAVSFIESNVTRELIEVTRRLAVQIDTVVHALQDLERILTFNAELAISELEVHRTAIPDETRSLVREMVLGSWGRGSLRLSEALAEAKGLPDVAQAEVRRTVLAQLEDFRLQVFDGRITELRRTLLRDVQLQGAFLARAGGWRKFVRSTSIQVQEGLTRTLGDDRITAIRHQLGFRQVTEVADPTAFAAPEPLGRLPTVYRRLFSDQALEAGDLLIGRDAEVQRALRALRDQPGVYRTVALIGLDGIGKRALANTVMRGLGGTRVTRFTPTQPVTSEDVDALLTENAGGAVLIEGVEQFFRLAPRGFEPLKRLVHGIVADQGKTAFILLFDTPVWHFANKVANLQAVFAEKIEMRTLTVTEIETALVARHNMSGYSLQFDAGTDLAWLVADLLARDEDPQRRRQAAWFRTLHEASDGVMHDALRLWMASIVDVDETNGALRIGAVQRPPLARIRRLPEAALLTLRQVLSQGSTDAEEHARQFRSTLKDAETHLAALSHAGLLEVRGDRYRVAEHLMAPVATVLQGRGWL